MKIVRALVLTALATAPLLAQQAPGTFNADKAHSQVSFTIRHMMSKVTGRFRDFDAAITLDRADLANSSVSFTIQAKSVDTANDNRDEHLRTSDFFDVANHPTITFRSVSVKPAGKDKYAVTGDLTLRGVTRRITLPVDLLGFATDARGDERAGFEVQTTLNRKDYNVLWNRTLDDGGFLLGDDVAIDISIEAVKKAAPATAK